METGRVAPETIRAWKRHLGREVEADSLRAQLVEGTLPQLFHDNAMQDPERTALTIDGQKITYGELDRFAAGAGGWLQAQGIGSGERVVLCGNNSLGFVIAYLGIVRAEGIVVPAGAALTESELRHFVEDSGATCALAQSDVLAHALPFSHQHGLSAVHISLLWGSRAVVHSKFDPERLCRAIEAEKATVLFAVPAIYETLTAWEGIEEADFSSLRLAVSGSSGLSPTLARKVSPILGQDVLERYGSTESGLSVSNPYDEPRKFGTVGFPLPGTELAIVDEEGHGMRPGEDGEIALRGPQVFSGYWGLPDATEESFYPGGWFRTGDVGRVDPEDRYLAITGRLKEMIITGGLNVYPREVELVVEDHAAVENAAVVGVPSEQWGEEVVAFVFPARDGEVDPEELTAHAREHLSSYKCPKRFLTVDQLPRNQVGKVLRDELIEKAEDSTGQ